MSDRPTQPGSYNGTLNAGDPRGISGTMLSGAGWCGQHGAYVVYAGQPGGCPRCRAIPRGHCPTHGRIPAGYACPACELRDGDGPEAARRLDVMHERMMLQFQLILDLYGQLEQRDALVKQLRDRVFRLENFFTQQA